MLKEQGLTYSEIAKIYDTSTSSVGRTFRSHEQWIRTQKTDEDIYNIINLYKNGISIREIGRMYHLSESSVSYLLKSNNIHIKSPSESKQIYTLNETYFDIINSHDKAYLLGWLWSDGHNSDRNQIVISLQESDRHILEIFNKELESNRPIKYIDRSKEKDCNRKTNIDLLLPISTCLIL